MPSSSKYKFNIFYLEYADINEYVIKDDSNTAILSVIENRSSCSKCCCIHFPAQLLIFNMDREEVMHIKRPLCLCLQVN